MADFFDDQNNMTEDDDIITLYNEVADKDEDFYHLATLDVDDKWFVVLKPVEKLDDIDEDEVLIYEIAENEDGNDVFKAIEDDALLQRVFDEFMAEVGKVEGVCDCGEDGCHDGNCSCCHH
jgi:uncharacterized protein YrzB (UPF0473 family)